MVTIEIDDETATVLAEQARRNGQTVPEYIRELIGLEAQTPGWCDESWEDIEREINELSTDGPSLPADFSRSDIYDDHN